MNFFKMCVLAMAVALAACGGSASVNGEAKAPSAGFKGGHFDESSAQPATGEEGLAPNEGEQTPPANQDTDTAQPRQDGLPPECDGKMPQAQKVAKNFVTCSCTRGNHEAMWTTYVWDQGFPGCKVPRPDDVLTRQVGSGSSENPYSGETEESAGDGNVTVTGSAASTQVSCATTIRGTDRIAVCQVQQNGADPESYSCVGPGVKQLSAAEQNRYRGGPPCTCKSGAPKKLGSPPNTWQCD